MRVAEIGKDLAGGEPVLVTREGHVSGIYVPLKDEGPLSKDLRRDLIVVLGRHLSDSLTAKGIAEEEIQEDFNAYRRSRR